MTQIRRVVVFVVLRHLSPGADGIFEVVDTGGVGKWNACSSDGVDELLLLL